MISPTMLTYEIERLDSKLTGGMGTRLQSVVSDVPECTVPVVGKLFLYYLIVSLEEAGFNHIILSLGYNMKL